MASKFQLSLIEWMSHLKKGSGRYKVDAVTLLANRVDALAQRLDRVNTPYSVGVHAICKTCGAQENTSVDCYKGSSTIEPLSF